jgi:peptidoglycan hydrolase-like protein with peptidoglycan-binding domain
MITLRLHLLRLLPFVCGGYRQLAIENLALRQQLTVYKANRAAAQTAPDGSPLVGPPGQSLGRVAAPPRDRVPRHRPAVAAAPLSRTLDQLSGPHEITTIQGHHCGAAPEAWPADEAPRGGLRTVVYVHGMKRPGGATHRPRGGSQSALFAQDEAPGDGTILERRARGALMISASVGVGGVNRTEDVRQVQQRLNLFVARLELEPLHVDGDCGPKTRAAIVAFQDDVVGMEVPDGRVDPGGRTWQVLDAAPSPAPALTPRPFAGPLAAVLAPGPRTPLADGDFSTAAANLGCDVAAIRAVARVESSRKPFDDLGRPTILYERHLFDRLTGGKFRAKHPDISNPEPGGYGTFASQYSKMERAYAVDADAALKACSWGMFQILGQNHQAAGFGTVVEYVKAMCQTEAEHLKAFVSFVRANPSMNTALRNHDWAGFARRYNGPDFHKNNYDVRMADAFREARGR